MSETFKILTEGNPTQIEMSREDLDLAVEVTSKLIDDFEGSDFWELSMYTKDVVENLLETLKAAQSTMSDEGTMLSLSLDKEQYWVLKRVFIHVQNFMEEEFEAEFDRIDEIADILVPPPLAGS
ncbi:MAG: hypothetical protein OEY94_10020 [Alphaproteobacteria bacterium]|nr:hypothetical protein [Alphaproteobacteria bacterium]